MTEIVIAALLAAGCVGAFWTARVCSRMLRALERLEASVKALSPARMEPESRGDARQERYEQGVANILAYGTREMLGRRGDVQ